MTQLRFFKIASLLLLIVNVILLVIMFRPEHRPHPPSQKRGGADKLLNLDETQHEIFLASAEKHKANIIQLNEDQKALIYQYFKTISKSDKSLQDSLIAEIRNYETSKIKLTYDHIQDIKSMLKPEQDKNFDRFLDHLLKAISERGEKK